MILIRSLLFQVYFIVLTFCMGLFAFAIRWFAPHLALTYAKKWTAFSITGLKRICNITISIQGLEHLPMHQPFLIASQHQSAFDTLVWMNILPRPAYVMKMELTKIPLVGPMLLLAGMIPVDRKGGSKALRDMISAVEAAAHVGRQIIIFPEGTRTDFQERVKLHPGIAAIAMQTQLPVYPVATNSGLCWPQKGVRKYPGIINIVVTPALAPMPRKEMLTQISEQWQKAEADFMFSSSSQTAL